MQCKIIDMKIIGIETRTTNQNGQAMQDIGGLWNRFFSENIISKIPNAVNSNVYAIYTDYEVIIQVNIPRFWDWKYLRLMKSQADWSEGSFLNRILRDFLLKEQCLRL